MRVCLEAEHFDLICDWDFGYIHSLISYHQLVSTCTLFPVLGVVEKLVTLTLYCESEKPIFSYIILPGQ